MRSHIEPNTNIEQERLKAHSSAFDGLLSLIPAKYYYDEATQEQWQQKKKSKQEQLQHKRAKFDPELKENADEYSNSYASAKDVMKNKEKNASKITLPQRIHASPDSDLVASNAEDKEDGLSEEIQNRGSLTRVEAADSEPETLPLISEEKSLIFDDEGNELAEEYRYEKNNDNSKHAKKGGRKDLSAEEQKKKEENLALLREKLNFKISLMRDKRKAPNSKNTAPKSREQILEERRRKAELKRQEKLKRKHEEIEDDEEEEEEEEDDETDSDSDNDASDGKQKDVVYGNIEFGDGSKLTTDLKRLRSKKHKGPANNDIKAHLLKLEQKKKKLANLSQEEQETLRDKENWQKMMLQVEGVKVKDDEKLLKKALKKKEKQKLRSETEWRERKQIVKDTTAARQKRREENLKARRDGKGKKGKNQPRLRKFTGTVNTLANKKKRAGFEGSAKSKGKSKK